MKIHDNITEPDNAVLVGASLGKTIGLDSLDELSSLCRTTNIVEVGRVVQNLHDICVTYYIGKGKVEEVRQLVEETRANVVVFDVELGGSKVRNLEKALNVPVLDRSKVILDIFASRAKSKEGQLQVELAQLKYNLPRLVGAGGLMSKMRNSVGMRGPGEKKLEMDKRKIKEQISALEKDLEKLKENRMLNKSKAIKSGKSRVCLVGYTNSGKTTLLNTMAKSGEVGEDKLFATLDPKTANIYINPDAPGEGADYTQYMGKQILLTDTVGFIDKLPHEFISAFESTLDETRGADLLLHIVDVASPNVVAQVEVVTEVLQKIGAGDVPVLCVLNKVDKLSDVGLNIAVKELQEKCDLKHFVPVSAKENKGIEILKQEIIRRLDR